MRKTKVMSASEAVKKYINDGMTVSAGGFYHCISYALTHEIIRQKKKKLSICQASFSILADQLIGAGCVDRIISSYCWMEVFGPCYAFRRAIEKQIPHKVEIEDYTNFAMIARFFAGSVGIPYLPLNTIKGSDMVDCTSLMKENKLKVMKDPFGSDIENVVVPALKPDVGYMHAQRADEYGNVQMWGILGDYPWSMRSCKEVIVTVEEIVSRDSIGRDPNRTIIPGYKVVAVVPEPFGAHPKPVQGFYDADKEFIFNYIKESRTESGWKNFMEKWVYDIDDRTEYIKKYKDTFGEKKYLNLKANDLTAGEVNYGF